MFEKFAKTLLDRYGSKVKYWIVVNQINMVQIEPWLSVGVTSDQYDNEEQALYQAMHNQFVGAAWAMQSLYIILIFISELWLLTVQSIQQLVIQMT